MDALVYADSPLADYFEGQAVPYDISRENTPPPPSSFAPPNFKEKLRTIRRSATSIQPSSEQILEQFRYIIVASHLLSDEAPAPSIHDDATERDQNLLQGAVATAVLSFTTAWTLYWARSRKSTLRSLTWYELSTYCIAAFFVGVALLLFLRRQYSKYVQQKAAACLSRLVKDSHTFDSTANRTLRFIQEVELVARGYDLSSTLPPVTRMEDRNALKRCQNLRAELVSTLTILITLYVESHNILQSFVIQQDLQRYHDIYEISLAEYSDAIKVANESTEEVRSSLKELRFAFRLHAVARQALLCDLLALRTTNGWHRVRQWRIVLTILQEVEEATLSRRQLLGSSLRNEEFGLDHEQNNAEGDQTTDLSRLMDSSPSSSHQYKVQLRRFEEVTHSIRALNAKLHIIKDEIAGLTSANTDEKVVSAALSKHYDALGTDIRALQHEWERGRNSMLVSVSITDHRSSLASSLSPKTPASPVPSLGGFTVVDGGPAEALALLNGDDRSSRSSDGTLYDEEVFEAVSKPMPRKRMSMGSAMTREEKIARLNEERRKRATLQEHADTTTNMLRELQMVIKHRPNTYAHSPSTPTNARVASL